ncbi:MAG: molecular chaperone TorD family protein [Pseudomonadota bacterium]
MNEAALEAEELARASLYGLIARLFYGAPDAGLLAALASARAPDPASPLGRAWAELVAAWRDAPLEAIEDEHTALFIGTGKAEITPYLSHYVIEHSADNPLVELRDQLARWGIARREGANEPEDHVAAVCEVMRFAIAVQQRPLQEQGVFFRRYVYRGASRFCDAVTASEKAHFYRHAARLFRAFLEVEREAFEMD